MLDIHFGGGNIGRGFIGEVLHNNGFDIIFVDVNEKIIDELNARGSYEIEIAEEGNDIQDFNIELDDDGQITLSLE